MSSKAGSKRLANSSSSSEPSNHTMVTEVASERPGGRVRAQVQVPQRVTTEQPGSRAPTRALSASSPPLQASRSSRKGIAFGKRSNSMKRNPNAAVTKSGWLYKQASSGVKQWNKRWFVLVDRCLFYYKDEKEESILGSIPLLSFRVAAVQPSDNISRKHTFKVTVCWVEEVPASNEQSLSPQAEHAGIRTYFFSAENTEEQESWIQAMGEAARVQIPPTQRHEKTDSENIPPSKHHHHHHRNAAHREHPKADPDAKTRGEGDGRGSEKLERKPERMESKKEPLAKANGVAGQDVPSEPGSPYPEAPRVPASTERPPQPNGWPYASPSRPGSTAYPPPDGESAAHRRSFAPRTNPEKIAQRKSSMTQLQQWVNLRRGNVPPEELRSPTRFYPVSRRVPDYYPPYSPQYPEDHQYYPPGVRPDSICSMPAYERVSPPWALDDKRHSFRNGGPYQLREWKEHPGFARQDVPVWLPGRQSTYFDEVDAASGSLRRMSLQPRSRSVPRSPSQGSYGHTRVYSPVRSPSARFERLPPRGEEIYADPSTFMMRRSISSPKYDFLGDRRPIPAGMYPYHYPASPTVHDKMDELLDLQLQRNLEYLDQQMSESETLISMVNRMVESSSPRAQLYMQVTTPFPEAYRETLHAYKISEQDTDKLLGKLCEQNKVLREQERLVQQLRAEKESLESALMGTHQELEMFGSQPAYPEKLLHKKESLQNQLINIRVELSQASTALANSTAEYETLESEVSALHDDLWEQLNLDLQNEMLNRQIQKEIWRIQDVMEGLRKNNPSRGTDTAKHRVAIGPSGTYSSNSPASPLSSASLTSPLSPFSLISGSQGSPTKPGPSEPKPSLEQSKKETQRAAAPCPTAEGLQSRQEQEAEKQAALNKVGIVPPRTKSPTEEEVVPTTGMLRRNGNGMANGLGSRERPKSAVFANDTKVKMSVEEQIDRMKRHQSGSMKEKRRSLQLPGSQQPDTPGTKAPASYKVVRRHRSIHEVDISDLEAALRSDDPSKVHETPREEIARLRKMELEPQHYDVDINKELSTPDKVLIPERYIELEPDTPLSPEEMKEKQKKVERIKTLIAKSSLQNVIPLGEGEVDAPQDPETQLQEQEKRIEISCALAAEASRRGRMLSAQCATPSPPTSPASPTPPTNPLSSEPSRVADCSHFMRV
ncbi:pleckstrin homology domain-containing family A member 6 isoform X1 [Numida meleagris]|nr:pleckstrin homology domain-containing family A member 6 isoform X1 [Numida meleagris]XP_021232933.1 pleckstrin homology domain-containing family A member 6 isoform X1 [Numida meleagris]XP_021232935.1 pleckstrin homology domain-containing family A member 6 isoform X1 [Numida meleagris]XP_021232936.1 pleckstrin homology domain-containing family A member 6 isoform X1 [Numida meleagris]